MAQRRFGIFKRDPGEAAADGDTELFDESSNDFAPADQGFESDQDSGPDTAEWVLAEGEGNDEDEDGQDEEQDGTDETSEPELEPAAAEQAEERSMHEILALEQDLERVKDEAADQLEAIEGRLGEAERRAEEAEERLAAAGDGPEPAPAPADDREPSADAEQARAAAEDQGRTVAATWLRDQLETAREEADERLERAVEEARREAEQQARPELADAGGETPAPPPPDENAELERLREELDDARSQIKRIRSEAEERTRIEVEATRTATQDRFAAELQMREQELEQEREEKTRIIESSNQRLGEIEQRAQAAAERVATAERELASEAQRLQENAEQRIATETKRAKSEAERIGREAEAARQTEVEPEENPVEPEFEPEDEAEPEEPKPKRRRTSLRPAGLLRSRRKAADDDAAAGAASIAELAEEAEKLGGEANGELPASELEPPTWIAEEPEPEPEAEVEPEAGPQQELESWEEPEPEQGDEAPEGMVSVSSAGFEELRELGMSVTQAKRVIRLREERGGFSSLDELNDVPGFPRAFLDQIKDQLVP